MTDWNPIRDVFEDVVRSSLPTSQQAFEPRWMKSSEANRYIAVDFGWKVLIDFTSSRNKVRRRENYTNEEGEFHERILSQDIVTFTVTVEAMEWNDNANQWALAVLTKIKARMRLTQNHEAFIAQCVAIVDEGEIVDLSRSKDGRQISAFSSDLFFVVGSEENTEESDPDGLDWFNRVEITPENITRPDGSIVQTETFIVESTD